MTTKKRSGRAGDVNPQVTVRPAPPSPQPERTGCYRPIDIDRSPGMTTKSGEGERDSHPR
ncbi:MAG UNVERIFIED_CONTAM: hypothetical protein LVR18_14985 [Planctomycetaceae bacterium]